VSNSAKRLRLQELSIEQLEMLLKDSPADLSIDLLLTVEEFVDRVGGVDAARAALAELDDHREAA
jgi:hypothetical protein